MRRLSTLVLFVIVASTLTCNHALAQSAVVQVNRDNRSISANAEYTLSVDPEVAVLHFAYFNTALEKDAAFRDNVRIANQILKALIDAGISESDISTDSLTLERQEEYRQNVRTGPAQFEARQAWTARVDARDAQKMLELVVHAGANDLSDPVWTVRDIAALEAKAYTSALGKARETAQQMANGLGVQLGDLIHADNGPTGPYRVVNTSTAIVSSGRVRTPEPVLKVFPKKVERHVSVNAVFAIK